MKILTFLISLFVFNSASAQISDFSTTSFTKADSIARQYHGSSLDNLPVLAYNLTANLNTDVEKFRAIYTWVCSNIKADTNQGSKVISKRKKYKNDSISYLKWNNEYKKTAFKKLLKQKKTMCTGYAYLIKELAFLSNIECKIIDGYGRTVFTNVESLELMNHSWNAVKLDNKWYLCDATWSSGYSIEGTFFSDYNTGYFLTDPILFAKNHYPNHKKWLLNEALINDTFIASPIVYGETFEHKIIPISPRTLTKEVEKNKKMTFNFKAIKPVKEDEVALIHYIGFDEKSFTIENFKNEKGQISFNHKFVQNGYYDVHLKVKGDIVATYTINVN